MTLGTSLAVQGLRLCASTAGGAGLIPGQGTKILYALWHSKKKKKKENDSFTQHLLKTFLASLRDAVIF